jgi:RNA polymerase sigma-70 factor (ECF subfamily)
MIIEAEPRSDCRAKAFTTTRWTVVLSSARCCDTGDPAHEALAQLCRTYWRPIFAFVCRRGYSAADAEDLTQDFFSSVLNGNLLQRANPARGKFRTLLLKALTDFLHDAKHRRSADKRGGRVHFVSWDEWAAEAPSHLAIPQQALSSWPAERVFDVRWAATVVERGLYRLAEECERRGRRRVFDILSGVLLADRSDVSLAELGRRLGASEATVKRLLHAMRERYRRLLREEVAETVESPAALDEEVRYLCAVLATESSTVAA